MLRSILVLCAWLLGYALAEAQDGVVLFQRAALRPELCVALRIQLSGAAEVRCVTETADASLVARLSAARAQLRREGANLGVLLERDPDPALVRMYIVTGQGDQAALTIERIENRPEPDVDRSLALKVRDAYEVITFVDRELPDRPAAAAGVLASARAAGQTQAAERGAPAALPARGPYLLSFLELGGGVGFGAGTRGFGHALLGVGRADVRLRYELAAGARLTSRLRERRDELGQITLREGAALLSGRVLYRWPRVEVGAALYAALAWTAAEGVTADGQVHHERVITPVLGLGPDLRVRLFRYVYLRLAPSLELAIIRQRFELDDRSVIDAGHVGATLPLSLVVTLPAEGVPEAFQP